MHGGLTDPKVIGRRGGLARPLTALRRAAREDDSLRELAAATLERALKGEDVDPAQLRAAQSLYSFRAQQPPSERQELGDYRGPLMPDGRRPISLGDVLAFAMTANASTRAVAEEAIAQAQAALAQAQAATPPEVSKESRSSETGKLTARGEGRALERDGAAEGDPRR